MPRRPKSPPPPEPPPPPMLDANQVVAYNFRAARELRGWTQEQTARLMAPYLGQELPKASISGIERSFDGERRRFFDAQELTAFARTFDLPLLWFFLPPPGYRGHRLAPGPMGVLGLVSLALGRADQLEDIRDRLEELREDDPRTAGEALAEASAFPEDLTWAHFQRSREEALFALVEEETSEIERLLGDLRRVLARFDDLSQRSHMANYPRQVYRAISHSIIGEDVFRKVLQTGDPADEGRYTMLRPRIVNQKRIEAAIDLDDPEIVRRLASVYDRAEELLREKLARQTRSPRPPAGGEDSAK